MGVITKSATITAKWNKYGLDASIEVETSRKVRESFSVVMNDDYLIDAPDGGLPFVHLVQSDQFGKLKLSDDIGSTAEDFFNLWAEGKLDFSSDYGSIQLMYFGSDPDPYFCWVYYDASKFSNVTTVTITFTITNDDGSTLSSTCQFREAPIGYKSIDIASYEKMNYDSSGKESGVVIFTNTEYKTTLETSLGISTTLIQFFFDNNMLYLEDTINDYQPEMTFKNGRLVATSESACPLINADSSDRTVAYDGVTRRPVFCWEYPIARSTCSHYLFAVNEERVTDTFSGYSTSYLYCCYVSNETTDDSKPTVAIWSSEQRTSSSSSTITYSKPSSAPSYCQLGILFRLNSADLCTNLAYACWLGYIYFQVVIQGPGTNVFKTTDAFGTTYSNQAQAYVNGGAYILPIIFVSSSILSSNNGIKVPFTNTGLYCLLGLTSYYDFASGQPGSPYQWAVRLWKQDGTYETYGTLYLANSTTAGWFGP